MKIGLVTMKLWIVPLNSWVVAMNSWVLPIISWLGFSKKVEFWGYKLCQKLKNLCSNLILKSEFQSSKPNLSYEWFYENEPWTSRVFMVSIHEIMDITLFLWLLSLFLWVDSSSNEPLWVKCISKTILLRGLPAFFRKATIKCHTMDRRIWSISVTNGLFLRS